MNVIVSVSENSLAAETSHGAIRAGFCVNLPGFVSRPGVCFQGLEKFFLPPHAFDRGRSLEVEGGGGGPIDATPAGWKYVARIDPTAALAVRALWALSP